MLKTEYTLADFLKFPLLALELWLTPRERETLAAILAFADEQKPHA